MAYQENFGGATLDHLQTALDVVKSLRINVSGLFEMLASGMRNEDGEDHDRNFRIELHAVMQKIYESIRDVDQYVSSLNSPVGHFNLGNTSLINQEVGSEQKLYCQLVDSYKWLEKVKEYSAIAGPNLGQNQMKRTYFSASLSAKRRRTLANNYVLPQQVDNSVQAIANTYKDMEITITRPSGTNAVLCITLGRTLRAIVILKGWLIEWVVVRGLSEDFSKDNETVDLWTESKFKVFQKVTDNANAAMLHFCVPTHPELSVRSFMTWLHSFITLFTQRCKKCCLHLSNNLPPTWRDLRSLEPFHEECKP